MDMIKDAEQGKIDLILTNQFGLQEIQPTVWKW